MTAEEQRIAIAMSLGWDEESARRGFETTVREQDGYTYSQISTKLPDYPNDLNACHEFEKVLDKMTGIHGPSVGICTGNEVYEDMLLGMCDHPIRATAPQRCEAFLKTINKWKNEP